MVEKSLLPFVSTTENCRAGWSLVFRQNGRNVCSWQRKLKTRQGSLLIQGAGIEAECWYLFGLPKQRSLSDDCGGNAFPIYIYSTYK